MRTSRALFVLVCALLAGCTSPHAQVEPSIAFTRLPPAGEGSATKLEGIEGRVANCQPGPSLDLEKAFSLIQAELGLKTPIAFRVIVDGRQRPLHPVPRDEVNRIGREALLNAFRHSRVRNIEIELAYARKRLRIVVRDNGCGFDQQVLRSGRDGHFGLLGMRQRAERIGARLHVWSSPQSGTEVELSVPGYVAFQDQPTHLLWKRANRLRPRKVVERGSVP